MTILNYNTDSQMLTGAMMAAFGGIQNPMTGIGTARDKFTYAVIGDMPLLSERDRINLVVNSRICRRVVEAYPKEAGAGWLEFTFGSNRYKSYGFNPDLLNKYFEDLGTGSLKKAIVEASIEARWHGAGYLLLGIDDGQAWDTKVDENRIQSLRWVEPLFENEVRPEIGVRRPEFYTIQRYREKLPDGDARLKVHISRLLPLHGDKLIGASSRYIGNGISVLQAMFGSFAACMQGLAASSSMLADYSVFKYKFNGMQQMLDDNRANLKQWKKANAAEKAVLLEEWGAPPGEYPPGMMDRFLSIQMSMSIIKGLMMDGESEDAEFINRNFGGIDSVLDKLIEQMVAACDMPRFKVLGTANQKGLGAEGRGEQDRYEWASLLNSWQEENWRQPLQYLTKVVLLAKDGPTGGRLPQGYDFQFANTLQLTQSEELALRKTHAETVNILIANGTLNPYEVRMSAYGAPKWTPEITIDESISNNMKDSLFPTQEDIPQQAPEDNQVKKDEWHADDSTPVKRILDWQGYKVGLQYLPFQLRHGKVLPCGYGHFQKTKGADNMAVDCYVGVNLNNNKIFEIKQLVNGEFDEVKIIIGVETIEEARALYLSVMPEEMFGGIEEITLAQLAEYKTTEETKADAFEDIPNYRPSIGASKCLNCQSGYSARRDGSGWYACDIHGHETKRDWVCDDWAERVKQLRADDSASFFWSGGELPVTSGNVYAINYENGGVLAFGYSSLEDAEIAFEYEFDVDIENGADVTDLLSQRVDELNFDDKNKVVRGNLCRDPRGRFVSCGKPVTKVESSLAKKRRENKEAREKAKLESKPKPEDSKKVPDKKPKPKKATNEPNKQSKAAKDISDNLVSFVNQMGAKQGFKERIAIDATDIMDNLVKKYGKQAVLNQLDEELKNLDNSLSSGRIKRLSGLTHTEPFTNNLRWAKSYIEDNI